MSVIDLKIKEIKEIQQNLLIEEDKVINLKKILSTKMRELTESQLDIYSSTQ